MSCYTAIRFVFSPLMRLVYRVRVEGKENLPPAGSGNYIVCPNHTSMRDPIVLGVSMKLPLRYMAKAELFKNPVASAFFTSLGAYPVTRGSGETGALKKTIAILKEGGCVAIFPQGTRFGGTDPRTTTAKKGVGMIVHSARSTVIPVCIQGDGFRVRPFRRTCVRIGKPIPYEEFGFGENYRQQYQEAADYIFSKVCEMIKQ